MEVLEVLIVALELVAAAEFVAAMKLVTAVKTATPMKSVPTTTTTAGQRGYRHRYHCQDHHCQDQLADHRSPPPVKVASTS
jgi:hypothetical protein